MDDKPLDLSKHSTYSIEQIEFPTDSDRNERHPAPSSCSGPSTSAGVSGGHHSPETREQSNEKKAKFRFVCQFCNKAFEYCSRWKTHVRAHTGEKPFKCNDCGKTFTQNSNLKTHMRSHTGEKPFECKDCGKTFTQNSNLKTHMRSHTEEKSFECMVCGKKFTLNGNLKRHLRLHTVQFSYQ